MNKWSFLLLPVLWLVQSATSERIFVDGRHGRFDYPSRSLLSNKRLTISEPRCSDKINELRSPTRDVRLSNKHDTLTRPSRSDHRLEQSELFSGNSKRVSTNVPFRFGDSTRYSTYDKTFLRGTEDSKLQTYIRSGPHKIYGEKRADRILDSYNDLNPIKIQRNRERSIKEEQDKIVMFRTRNIRDLSRSDVQDVRFERNNVREGRTDERRNNNMKRTLNIYNQRYEVTDKKEISDRYMVARLERGRYINKRSLVSRLNERDEIARNSGRRLVESYPDQRLRRHRVRVDSLPENRQIRRREVSFNLENGGNSRYISIQNIERFLEPGTNRQIRGNNLYRLHEQDFVDHLTRNMRDNLRIVENDQIETSDRRNLAIRRTVIEHREKDERYRLASENGRVSDLRAIRLGMERHLENMLGENRDTEHTFKDRVFEQVRERRTNDIRLNRLQFRSIQTDNRNGKRLESDTNRRLLRQGTRINRIVFDLRSSNNYRNVHHVDRDILRDIEVERRVENRIRQLRNVRENREENYNDGSIQKRERTLSNIHKRNQAVRSTRIIPERSVERIELRTVSPPEREINNSRKRIKERFGKENRLSRRIAKRITENDVLGAMTRETRYDNDAIEDTERNNNRNSRSRNEGERLTPRDQRSFNLRKNNVETENRMRNRQMRIGINISQRLQSDERILNQLYARYNFKTMAEERAKAIDEIPFAETDNTNDYFRFNKLASVEIRAVKMPNIRAFKTIERRDNGRRMLRDSNSVIETRGNILKFEIRDRRSRITGQNKILIRYEERAFDFSANRLSEPQRNVVNEYRMQLTRNENNNDRRMREIREVRSINDKSDIRDSRREVTMRPTITVDLSNKRNRNVQTRQVTRNSKEIAEQRFMRNVRISERRSKNMPRDLQEYVSDRRRETNRESKIYTSIRDLMTPVQNERLERSKDMGFISNSQSETHRRSLSRSQTNGEEPLMRAAITTGYEVFKDKNQTDSQIFVMKWQYVFYLIQGVYILSLFTKQKNHSHGMKSRFANWFLPFPILKLD